MQSRKSLLRAHIVALVLDAEEVWHICAAYIACFGQWRANAIVI